MIKMVCLSVPNASNACACRVLTWSEKRPLKMFVKTAKDVDVVSYSDPLFYLYLSI